ncbi:TonB-dependent receptor [Flavicella sp.]|uniref:TonB-dependent receptor n=1 Tax=Flavicella sp. TaxID=2957742 RepID=UPI00301597DD
MKKNCKTNLFKLILLLVVPLVLGAKVNAQNGTIQGVITDENGMYVPGANVIIESIKKGDITDFDGRFTIVSVPEGTYILKITYLGYKDINHKVTVVAADAVMVNVKLKSSSLELEEVQIIGHGISGQSKALNTQKNNLNITNVVSTDQIGKFPDANIGDAVKRIPGITMQVDQGEARNIIIRGLSPQLNSVTLNGSRIPSAEGNNRNVQMDLIPSDMIQTIEVTKTITPDMDADALGGSVNLITRTAPQDFRLSATAGTGINFITDKRILNGSLLVGDRTENGKFGWMLSASVNDNDFGSDNIEANWTDEFNYYTGIDDGNGEPILKEVDVDPYTDELQQRTYIVQRIRRSLSANFEYQINANNNIYLKTMYNWRDDRENRYVLEYNILDGEDIEVEDFTVSNGVLARFPVDVKRQTKGGIDNSRNKNTRLEDQRMQNYTLGGNHVFGKLKIDWMTSYAKASEERLDERYAEFESEYIVLNDNTNPEYPLYTPEDLAYANDLENFVFGEITNENRYTDEENFNVFVNFELPVDLFENGGGFVKFGARGRFKNKIRDNNFFDYDLEDMYPNMSLVTTKNMSKSNNYVGSQYQAGYFADEKWLGGLDLSTGGVSVPANFLSDNFEVKENVYAGYAMINQKVTEKLDVLVGLRLESTDLTAIGNEIEDGENVIGKITKKNSYLNVLPGVHLKYDLNDKTVFRFAWTNTLARPNYADLIPTIDVVYREEEIVVGNPDLDPTTSMNFDLSAEYYFKKVGLLSGGLFYKSINNFIYIFQSEAPDDYYGLDTAGYDVFQSLNGDDASVFGMEFAFQKQLDFLPGFAKNFNIYLNYTYLTSDANGIRNEDGEERNDIDLPNTSPNMFNCSLEYGYDRFSTRLSANFSDAYVDEIGGNAFEDRYYDQQFFLDFNVSFAVNKNLRVFADWNNITNQELRYYQGVKERTQQSEFYGSRVSVGLKYDVF